MFACVYADMLAGPAPKPRVVLMHVGSLVAQVLVFSQFNIMLDIMSSFCGYRGYNYERIDGSVASTARQPAIDRFNDPDGDSFIFLLTTKAGGVGINLTAADTVIIYDSDWNPQNDLQAIARCHRIGQTQMVRIYRLITKKTYEAEMFRRAGRKLGLSQAVFETGGMVATFADNNAEDDTDGNLSSLVKLDVDKVLLARCCWCVWCCGGIDVVRGACRSRCCSSLARTRC